MTDGGCKAAACLPAVLPSTPFLTQSKIPLVRLTMGLGIWGATYYTALGLNLLLKAAVHAALTMSQCCLTAIFWLQCLCYGHLSLSQPTINHIFPDLLGVEVYL